MIERWDVTIPELTGEEPRGVWLYLPEKYFTYPEQRFPVLYMFDGHNVFFDETATYGKSWGMKEYMDKTGTELIIAAVQCNCHPDYSRLEEYSPFDFTMNPHFSINHTDEPVFIEGLGKQTMDWFTQILKPDIDARYRTLSDRRHTYIAGSSMGGLMSLYAVLHYNDIFSGAAALSPSLWMDADASRKMIASAHPSPDTILYMDMGSAEWHNRARLLSAFGDMTAEILKKNILVTSRIIPEGSHCEASWERQIPFFLNTLLYSYR